MSDDAVSEDEVRHVARLARVSLADEEVDRFAAQFEEITDAFDALEDVPSVDGSTELTNVLRPDVTRASLTNEEALRNAPETEDGRFKGPNVS
ncbi:Asp-tRNA(Asn)/Glu-tRNA(Gln) amidotransferase subunit GatC [Halovivax cerinus]|uniref:Aspartyl/glutamyl-tRNA(Asn/Gln) amidotransferase subunit C n=1 Tax=Halovivax cerinus TaxID=1487865 RepID=A0ABD5NJE0_9EURY|nr:Asp-tRNA(Asn)/Glu-tRNA(Gln) amidotransferase subunit GatC [Halovivax cerinus]